MAKSAPNTKVEDVLSSVRRLVSEEIPRNERPVLPEGAGALVLTNAQRIESNASVRIAGRTLEERIAELEAAVGETANDDEFEPDGSEDQAQHRPDRIVYTRPPESAESDQMQRNTLRLSQIALIDTGPDTEEADEQVDVPLPFRSKAGVASDDDGTPGEPSEAPMAEDVKETLTAAEVHIFTSPDDEIERIEARLNGEPEPVRPAEPKLETPHTEEDKDEVPVLAETQGEDNPPEDQELSEDDVVITPVIEEDAPDSDSADVLELSSEATDAAFQADLEDAVAASVNIEDDEPEAMGVETDIAEEAIEDAVIDVLDEEDLRPIVARMVREELQGELGERITRNVRKLVRREILRALAARDAE